MSPTLRQLLPVGISIVIIITIAILRNYSKTLAAIFATMPINLPLSLWIVAGSDGTDQAAMELYSRSLVIGILPTVLFCITAWFCFRAGWTLLPTLLVGYAVWGIFLALLILIRGGL